MRGRVAEYDIAEADIAPDERDEGSESDSGMPHTPPFRGPGAPEKRRGIGQLTG